MPTSDRRELPPHLIAARKREIEDMLGASIDSPEGSEAFLASVILTMLIRPEFDRNQKADIFRAYCRHMHNDGKWYFISTTLDVLNEPGQEDMVRANITLVRALMELAEKVRKDCILSNNQLINLVEAFTEDKR